MAEQSKIVGYKKIFGFVLPDWVDESMINRFIMLAIGCVVMGLVLILFVNPRQEDLAKMKTSLVETTKRYENLKESKNGLDQIGKDLTETQQLAIFAAMPISYTPEDAISSIRSVARDTGVSILGYSLPSGVLYDDSQSKDLSGGSGAKGDPVTFKTFAIKVTVYGNVNSILNFNSKFQKTLPFGRVSDLAIEEAATMVGPGSKSNVQLDLNINYYLPQLHSFDLSNLKKLSSEDLATARDLATYSTPGLVSSSDLYSIESSGSALVIPSSGVTKPLF